MRTALVLSVVCAAVAAQTRPTNCDALIPGTPLPGVNAAAPRILDLGSARSVRVQILGHSESRGYHRFLQPMLDANPPLPGVRFTVDNGYIGGHEAWRWATPGQRGYRRIDQILSQLQTPMIVLGLFSNNASRPIRRGDPSDPRFTGFAADLEAIADHLYSGGKGAAMVYFSSHRYKPSNSQPSFHERAATTYLIEQAQRQRKAYIKPGPEQHDLHWCCFPACYAADRAHTNADGDRLMAQAWYNLLVAELTGCSVEPYGAGTPGTGGVVPVLLPSGGLPRAGNAAFGLRTTKARGGAALVYALGVARLPGPVLVAPVLAIAARASGGGSHTLALPVPDDRAIHGARVHAQAGARDPNGGFLGFALTGGVTMAFCR